LIVFFYANQAINATTIILKLNLCALEPFDDNNNDRVQWDPLIIYKFKYQERQKMAPAPWKNIIKSLITEHFKTSNRMQPMQSAERPPNIVWTYFNKGTERCLESMIPPITKGDPQLMRDVQMHLLKEFV
ncbi:6627_t:CDS:2, partial [Entrophospora sp. SA101]